MNSRILKSQSRFVLSAQDVYGNATLQNRETELQLSQSQKIKNLLSEKVWDPTVGSLRSQGIEEYSRESKSTLGRVPYRQKVAVRGTVESRIWVQRTARNQRENGKRKKEKNDVVVTEKMFSHQPPHSPPEQYKAVICYTNPEGGNKVEDVQKMLNAEAAQHLKSLVILVVERNCKTSIILKICCCLCRRRDGCFTFLWKISYQARNKLG